MSVIISSVKTDNFEIEYAKFGCGEKPFVMIPGLSIKSVIESAELVESSYSMFEKDFTVYLFDRRKNVAAGHSLDEMAKDIAVALNALGIDNACVFGASQGGMIAQLLAIKRPELVSKLILASTASRLNNTAKMVVENWIDLAEKGEAEALCEDFVKLLYSEDFALKYGEAIVKYNSSCTKEELKKFVILAKACEDLSLYDRLGDIKCATLVIGAENDCVLTPKASVEIAEKLGSEYYIYPAPYAHAVYDEAPDYKDRIMKFFLG